MVHYMRSNLVYKTTVFYSLIEKKFVQHIADMPTGRSLWDIPFPSFVNGLYGYKIVKRPELNHKASEQKFYEISLYKYYKVSE